MRYMLQEVLNYRVVSSTSHATDNADYYDLLEFLFPYYLNEALRKGMYKEYVDRQYNDANAKGTIEIARQLKTNMPFIGRVAYRTREFSFDNPVTQLIRHTIEKIQNGKSILLSGNEEVKQNIRDIRRVTRSYEKLARQDVMQTNFFNPVTHGYFQEYAVLQRLCLQILKEKRVGFGRDARQINGIIIDVAWLWEAYIWHITGWKHYGRKRGLRTLPFYEQFGDDGQQHRYPDFEYAGIPIDTKYKRHIDKRNDYYQLVTYIHLMKTTKGGFLQPTDNLEQAGYQRLGTLYGGGELFSFKFLVPQVARDYEDFQRQMRQEETTLRRAVATDVVVD